MKNLNRNIVFLLLCLFVSNSSKIFSVNVTFIVDGSLKVVNGPIFNGPYITISKYNQTGPPTKLNLNANMSTVMQLDYGTQIEMQMGTETKIKRYLVPNIDTTFTISNCSLEAYNNVCTITQTPAPIINQVYDSNGSFIGTASLAAYSSGACGGFPNVPRTPYDLTLSVPVPGIINGQQINQSPWFGCGNEAPCPSSTVITASKSSTGDAAFDMTCKCVDTGLPANNDGSCTCPPGQMLIAGFGCRARPTSCLAIGQTVFFDTTTSMTACQPCPKGQTTNDGLYCEAITCPTGQQLVGNVCTAKPITNCFSQNGTTCSACNTGYSLNGNVCTATPLANCSSQNGTTCSACNTAYTLNGNACTATPIANCSSQNGTTCSTCNTGYTLSGNACNATPIANCSSQNGTTCSACNTGFILNDNACLQCTNGQIALKGANQCCASGDTLDSMGNCLAPTPPVVASNIEAAKTVTTNTQNVIAAATKTLANLPTEQAAPLKQAISTTAQVIKAAAPKLAEAKITLSNAKTPAAIKQINDTTSKIKANVIASKAKLAAVNLQVLTLVPVKKPIVSTPVKKTQVLTLNPIK
ncbi:MAG: hypothetical protein P4L22_06610 [Candidatus Babeliales bacterium]|nr:hypothetical protein [Candidatus Babeliales bacterium]